MFATGSTKHKNVSFRTRVYNIYRKDTEHLYHAFVYSLVIENVMNNDPFIRDFVTLNKAVINYLPRCSYHLLYIIQILNEKLFT